VQVFSLQGSPICSLGLADVCGLAPVPDEFLLADGHGGLSRGDSSGIWRLSQANCAWDNHPVPVAV